MSRDIEVNSFYRHFKGNIYQVKAVAKNADDMEEMVVYQAMYSPFEYYVRKYDEFAGEVDRKKYPDATQKYRFEKYVPTGHKDEEKNGIKSVPASENISDEISEELLKKALMSGSPEKYIGNKMSDEQIAEKGYMLILDTRDTKEKRQLMVGIKPYLNKRLLHNIAASMDIVLDEADFETQYESLLHCLDTIGRFEGGRLR